MEFSNEYLNFLKKAGIESNDSQWKMAENAFEQYARKLKELEEFWEVYTQRMERDWDEKVPPLAKVEKLPQFCFDSPKTAIEQLEHANQLLDKIKMKAQFLNLGSLLP